jgi:hypothetical protein
MHHDEMARGIVRATRTHQNSARATRAALILATTIGLGACADESPVEPKARIPEGGVPSVALGINILPVGQTFPDKVAYVTGSPPGALPFVQVYDKWGNQMARFQAFTDTWDQVGPGADVAVGDINGDGFLDILAGEGSVPTSPYGSRFGVWDGKTGAWIGGFSLSLGQKGGLRVAAGDIDNDGRDEIFTCFGPSNQVTRMDVLRYNPSVPNIGYVKSSMTLGLITGTNSYEGCHVAGGDVTGDNKDEAVVVFDGTNNALLVQDYTGKHGSPLRKKPFGSTYTASMSVAVGDRNGDGYAEVFLGRLSSEDKMPPVRMFDGLALITDYYLPTPTILYPINSLTYTGVWVGARDISGDGRMELLAKPRSTYGTSSYQALMGPEFTVPWLNRVEPSNVPAGGPIG